MAFRVPKSHYYFSVLRKIAGCFTLKMGGLLRELIHGFYVKNVTLIVTFFTVFGNYTNIFGNYSYIAPFLHLSPESLYSSALAGGRSPFIPPSTTSIFCPIHPPPTTGSEENSVEGMVEGEGGMKGVEVEGRGSFHPKIPMKRAIFEPGGRTEGVFRYSPKFVYLFGGRSEKGGESRKKFVSLQRITQFRSFL
jgi:hypothetical protein